MDTKVFNIDENNIDINILSYCASIINSGGLVVFPTETVYGLGASAINEKAAKKIFEAKGRPQDNPLIVHVDSKDIAPLVTKVTKEAKLLMDKFWPGPLTIILNKANIIPNTISAGLDTIAIRMPSNKIASELIRLSKVPIAAPSANISGRPSPTKLSHVIEDLYGKVDVIIGGGEADIGLESTVVDLTEKPSILRPGGITYEQLKEVIDDIYIDPAIMKKPDKDFKPKAPGMKYRHYAPTASMCIVCGSLDNIVDKIKELSGKEIIQGKRVGVLASSQTSKLYNAGTILSMGDREKPETIAASIFKRLREFDDLKVDVIFAEGIEEKDIGLAIMNRMKKAAGFNIIEVG